MLIPARNEAGAIQRAVRAVLQSRSIEFEVVVMDDSSTDGTDAAVLALAAEDVRVRLERAPALPSGWNGKQHACWYLAQAAKHPVLCFVDADVCVAPECVVRMAGLLLAGNNGLVSGFPRQITVTTLEWMLLPLIHFVLLGFLPIARMRAGTDPALAAGCGQFMMVRADDYFACGGHSAMRLTMHDGLRMPRLFREHGFRTDLADLTDLAGCRMYTTAAQVWSGLAKNATEGLAAPARIVPVTAIFLLGQVAPFLLLLSLGASFLHLGTQSQFRIGINWKSLLIGGCACICVIADWLVRVASARRFKQDWRGTLLHPVGVVLLLLVQWYALIRKLSGRAVGWRGRDYIGN